LKPFSLESFVVTAIQTYSGSGSQRALRGPRETQPVPRGSVDKFL